MYKLRDLPSSERPRERLSSYGAFALSDSELLALVLRSGGKNKSATTLAATLLTKFDGLNNLLMASVEELTAIPDIGFAKACGLKAVFELAVRISRNLDTSLRQVIKTPKQVYDLMNPFFMDKKKEHLVVISLDSRSRVIAYDIVSIGTNTSTYSEPREVFKHAISRNAVSIIISHNHPSGNASPSHEDILTTSEIVSASKIMKIPVLDHVVVAGSEFLSMKAAGLFSVKNFANKGGEENEIK